MELKWSQELHLISAMYTNVPNRRYQSIYNTRESNNTFIKQFNEKRIDSWNVKDI